MAKESKESRLFRTIYADPPWPERGAGRIRRGADAHYRVMSVAAIAALPVSQIAAANAHLYLWTTNNYLPAGIEVMAAWGFRYVTTITWAKGRPGLGQFFQGMTEHCLFGVRGRLRYRYTPTGKRALGKTLITASVGDHSTKPEEMRRQIENVSYPPYIELFARKKSPGWDVWGDQVDSTTKFPAT